MRVETARNLFALAWAASLAYVVSSLAGLPEVVASNFGAGGAAQGFMTRRVYGVFFVAFSALLPLVLVSAFTWLPRRFSRFVNVPHRELWLTPELRDTLFRRLALAGYFVAGAAALFFGAMHALLVDANTHAPPRLAQGPFVALLIAFVACTLATALGLSLAMRKIPSRGQRD
ncbi:MAG: hypothetical protein FJ091_02560 [Deltaproteobacteria bacterium]|nr:hypothetical protein [Deltaproteobacteria bacterium]